MNCSGSPFIGVLSVLKDSSEEVSDKSDSVSDQSMLSSRLLSPMKKIWELGISSVKLGGLC